MLLQVADLVAEGPVLECGDGVGGEVETVERLVEAETVCDGGHLGEVQGEVTTCLGEARRGVHLGVVDGEAGQVRVEGDGECGQARVGADDGQQLVITLTTCTYLGLLIRGCPRMT